MLNQPGLRALNLQKVRLLDRLSNSNPELAQQIRTTKLDWYTMRNQAGEDDEPAEVFIYDEIGGSFGVDASAFVQDLSAITANEIVCRINSPGGLLIDGIAIGNALAQHPAMITTRVDGMAASAASVVFVAGDICEACEGSQVMVHDASVGAGGNPRELRELADWLDDQSQNVAAIYARKAGGTAEEWRERMQAETWMFAPEAVEMKLADSIYVSKKNPAMADEEEPEEDDEKPAMHNVHSSEMLESLMNRSHRLTNRGFKFLGRNKAPEPVPASNSFADLLNAWRR